MKVNYLSILGLLIAGVAISIVGRGFGIPDSLTLLLSGIQGLIWPWPVITLKEQE